MAANNLKSVALAMLDAGYCPLPAMAREKRPDPSIVPDWKKYQDRRPTEAQVRRWFQTAEAICVVAGEASGGLEIVDFDDGEESYGKWRRIVGKEAPELLERLVVESTPSGGRHVFYRCEEQVLGNRRLAKRRIVADGPDPILIGGKRHTPRSIDGEFIVEFAAIETRGEGGLCLCAPSHGYAWEIGDFDDLPTLTRREQFILISAAKSLDELPPEPQRAGDAENADLRPGDDYNRRVQPSDVEELLTRHGWTYVRTVAHRQHWRRPNKTIGQTATLGVYDGVLRFYVFSSNAAPFDTDTSYTPFAIFALLECGGDFSEAARRLRGQGYDTDAEQQTAGTENGGNTADLLIDIANERFRVGLDQNGEPFVADKDRPTIIYSMGSKSREIAAMLCAEFRQRHGRTPSATAARDALNVLQGDAYGRERETTHVRVADVGEASLIDLGDPTGRAIEVDRHGYRVRSDAAVLFKRTKLTSLLPPPHPACAPRDFLQVRDFLNIADRDWPLFVAWMVASLTEEMPHPVLLLVGEQGTGKTTAARMAIRLIDPSNADTRTPPATVRDWVVAASASWAIVLDNLSGIPVWLSDALCASVTGLAHAGRQLYTDDGISLFKFRTCVLLTSIDVGAIRGDLADRTIRIELQQIDDRSRRTESEIAEAFDRSFPTMFGGLLAACASAKKALANVRLDEAPRMADFAKVAKALDVACPELTGGKAFSLFMKQRTQLSEDVVDDDVVGLAVRLLLRSHDEWEGSKTDLLHALFGVAEIDPKKVPKDWPQTGRAMAARLKRLAPALRQVGVQYEAELPRASDPKRSRRCRLSRTGGNRPDRPNVRPDASGPDRPASTRGSVRRTRDDLDDLDG